MTENLLYRRKKSDYNISMRWKLVIIVISFAVLVCLLASSLLGNWLLYTLAKDETLWITHNNYKNIKDVVKWVEDFEINHHRLPLHAELSSIVNKYDGMSLITDPKKQGTGFILKFTFGDTWYNAIYDTNRPGVLVYDFSADDYWQKKLSSLKKDTKESILDYIL